MNWVALIEDVLQNPPLAFDPNRQSLKAWVTYCLRDRGFKVVYAQEADFAIDLQQGRVYVKTGEQATDLNPEFAWIIRDPATNQMRIIPPRQG
jgi:hypothetical protein